LRDQQKPTLGEFWEARARAGFWPTRAISYRLGAVLAWILSRLGFTPNRVSLLSLLVTGAGLWAALYFAPGWPAQGVAIFLVLNVAYALDCADGLLARACGLGTRFGAFFDKFIDVLTLALMVGVLATAAGEEQWCWIDLPPALGVAFALGVRLGLCVLMWLNEFEGGMPERSRVDARQRNFTWYLRRGAGLLCDQVVYIAVISSAWASGSFWDALWIYHSIIAILAGGYLFLLYRDGEASRRSGSS
jgi:phosphatidylglycerophosphate synthase